MVNLMVLVLVLRELEERWESQIVVTLLAQPQRRVRRAAKGAGLAAATVPMGSRIMAPLVLMVRMHDQWHQEGMPQQLLRRCRLKPPPLWLQVWATPQVT